MSSGPEARGPLDMKPVNPWPAHIRFYGEGALRCNGKPPPLIRPPPKEHGMGMNLPLHAWKLHESVASKNIHRKSLTEMVFGVT